ncbi:small subunit rRNA processing protein, putative [Plasmodium berghei]|uniref:Pre-rRNA-processing protein ESF2, putative n=2 Tax=Plasmodium berghei TaxID=5821 RepID=A0A509AGU8_PLABA|nr:pre-rRNA-processing protein ESF2, putative [Plasmodium berghei ANKA]CXI19554.1 small subunit rRNA processing protein, putative [Plasmodium berghei]SCM19860.1 small subunit rRNA processing protein, putative [Plasmodium berghei]SCN23595.1 small subunit rRNA processing protein, putative [Plasmodium berghei]SCO59163.1 small subunit rRNA processing protein, putative [Plasmodium berghei]SCO59946.1 small subunit rRNA processing protein, putative [Plasmodium berghei]|eukprot:XP_034420676.1 pre-rRNA-processing protein ESF2, putative [Plasmodium berghei ANKA]
MDNGSDINSNQKQINKENNKHGKVKKNNTEVVENDRTHEMNELTDERFQFNDSLWKHVKKEESKKGIIYLSHIPVGLYPSKIREFFSKYGEIDKIHLNKIKNDENNILSKETNHKKIKYKDGYVEFVNKKDAINVEKLLNNQIISGKKRKNILRDNFWHLKYLKNFTWNDLVSSVLYRNISRQEKFKHALKDMYKTYEEYLEKNMSKKKNKKINDKIETTTTKNKYISKKKKTLSTNKSVKLNFITLKKNDIKDQSQINTNSNNNMEIENKKEKDNIVSSNLLGMFM